jgi:hypothetical protein
MIPRPDPNDFLGDGIDFSFDLIGYERAVVEWLTQTNENEAQDA